MTHRPVANSHGVQFRVLCVKAGVSRKHQERESQERCPATYIFSIYSAKQMSFISIFADKVKMRLPKIWQSVDSLLERKGHRRTGFKIRSPSCDGAATAGSGEQEQEVLLVVVQLLSH